ncbi:hypothetical protein [Providencia hangzhouensis]|uniref:hypothetical protein n=1 Tax=Providencia hangzhouensis TaxID=3031799 RepID=UPI0034DDC585
MQTYFKYLMPLKVTISALCEGDDFWCSEDKISIQYNTMLMDKNISFSFHSAYINKTLSPIKYTKNKSYFTVEDIIKIVRTIFVQLLHICLNVNVVKVLPPWFKNASIGDYYIEIYSLTLGVGL